MRILYVDDDADSRKMLAVLLGRAGNEVVTASSASHGLELTKQGSFALIILDNWFKEGSGVELCQQIRGFDTHTPIIFFSGAGCESDIEEAMQSGANAYLIKPVDVEHLEQTITRLLTAEKLCVHRKGLENVKDQSEHVLSTSRKLIDETRQKIRKMASSNTSAKKAK